MRFVQTEFSNFSHASVFLVRRGFLLTASHEVMLTAFSIQHAVMLFCNPRLLLFFKNMSIFVVIHSPADDRFIN